MRSYTFALLILIPSMAACARAKPPAPVDVSSLPPLPRSSIAAVVQSRDKLGLNDEQVRRLEEIDQEREKADAVVEDEADKRDQEAKATAKANNATGPIPAGGRGGGGHAGGRGIRSGASSAHHKAGDETATDQAKLDDNDTKAFLEAEQVLTEGQRDAAREIASDYRAELFDRRRLDQGSTADK
jgi:hypothetical protein